MEPAGCRNRALRDYCRGSVRSEALWNQPVAVIERLEGAVRARLGKNCCDNLSAAVTEALEVVVRARLGQNCCDNLSVAVTEALEVVVRAQFGKKLLTAWHRNIAAQKSQKPSTQSQTPKSQKLTPLQTKGIRI